MTQKELVKILNQMDCDVTHIEFEEPPQTPFIAYFKASENQYGSDSKNFLSEATFIIELYTEYTDYETVEKLDKLLECIEFSKTQQKIKDERLLLTAYTITSLNKI